MTDVGAATSPVRFGRAVRHCFKRYAGFRGRATRSEYWWFVLFAVLLNAGAYAALTLIAFVAFLVAKTPDALASSKVLAPALIGLQLAAVLGVLPPLLAVSVRRFHDVGLSGWFYASTVAVYLLAAFQNAAAPIAFLPAVVLLAVLATLVVACLRGSRGANRYGNGRGDAIADVFGADPNETPAG